MTVLVTGATGFVGRALAARLARDGRDVRGVARATAPDLGDPTADWRRHLDGVDAVVHLAAKVHVMRGAAALADEFARVNTAGTLRLAQQAAEAGVKRFVFVSTIKVHGESGRMTEDTPRAPQDPYGQSKKAAEDGLMALAAASGLSVAIVRPPLVYGPGVRANFGALAAAVRRGIPLPLGAIRNARSLVGVENLADLLAVAAAHPAAEGPFLASDGDDLSTPELVRRLAAANGVHPRLLNVPVWCLQGLGTVLGKGGAIRRLTESLVVDSSRARLVLGWRPPLTVDEQLRRMFAS